MNVITIYGYTDKFCAELAEHNIYVDSEKCSETERNLATGILNF